MQNIYVIPIRYEIQLGIDVMTLYPDFVLLLTPKLGWKVVERTPFHIIWTERNKHIGEMEWLNFIGKWLVEMGFSHSPFECNIDGTKAYAFEIKGYGR